MPVVRAVAPDSVDRDLARLRAAGLLLETASYPDIQQRLEAAADHPTTIEFPEGEYLKGLIVVKKAG